MARDTKLAYIIAETFIIFVLILFILKIATPTFLGVAFKINQ